MPSPFPRLSPIFSSLVAAAALAACTSQPVDDDPFAGISRDEARALGGKVDGTDICDVNGWYGDGICDDFCARHDSDCACAGEGCSLEVEFLGVGGFMLRYGGDAILTAPLYTNPNLLDSTLGEAHADPALIDELSARTSFDDVRAILVGHAHYDHLLDVPYVWPKTPNAQIIGNRTMTHILAAYAPDRPDRCASTPPQDVQIPRERVLQLNDPLGVLGRDYVDYRMCPELDPEGDGSPGEWVHVEGSNVRIRALCSRHPAQFAFYHFGEGAIGADLCEPPPSAGDWLEGLTLAYLIDFLDPETGQPIHRIYYQDAPTNGPTGHVAPELLAEKDVDVAILCVGTFAQVRDQPGEILRAIHPRYTIGGHWEDFFRTQEEEIRPVPFHDVNLYESRAASAITEDGRTMPDVMVDGALQSAREWLPKPGTVFQFPAE